MNHLLSEYLGEVWCVVALLAVWSARAASAPHLRIWRYWFVISRALHAHLSSVAPAADSTVAPGLSRTSHTIDNILLLDPKAMHYNLLVLVTCVCESCCAPGCGPAPPRAPGAPACLRAPAPPPAESSASPPSFPCTRPALPSPRTTASDPLKFDKFFSDYYDKSLQF